MSNSLKIVMYAANLRHWGQLDPRSLNEDVPSPAGTEIAMMGVARGLARRGHRVTVFANCEGGTYDGVEYLPADLALPILTSVESDAIISWQDSSVFLYPVKTKLRVLMSQSSQLGLGQAADKVDRYFSISRHSAQLLLDSDPYADPDRMWVTRNGLDLSRFPATDPRYGTSAEVAAAQADEEKDPHSLVWTSSPDRGLHHLVDIFKKVRAAVPDATLTVLYDFDKTLASYKQGQPGSAFVRWLEKAAELRETDGVRVLNHLSQPQVAGILSKTAVYAYPCDPIRPTETYCIAATEAMAAGCSVIVSDADCLEENYDTAASVLTRPIDHDEWAREIVRQMTDRDSRLFRAAKGIELARRCSFDDVAWEWECFIESYLDGGLITPDRSLAAVLGK